MRKIRVKQALLATATLVSEHLHRLIGHRARFPLSPLTARRPGWGVH